MHSQVKQLPNGNAAIGQSRSRQTHKKSTMTRARMKSEAKKLRIKGVFVRKIAERFGVSTVLVYSWLRQETTLGQVMSPPKQLRIRPEAGKVNENARIVFASGIALEIPLSQVDKNLLQNLCEVQ